MFKKIKISFLVPVLKGGGSERNIINLISNIDNSIYEASLVTGNIGGDLTGSIPKEVAIINLSSGNIISLFFKLFSYLKKEKPDILFSALPHINTIAMMAKTFSRANTKVILTEHTTFSLIPSTARTWQKKFAARFVLPHFMRFFYPLADSIICVSAGVAEDLYHVVGKLPTIKIIYNPVTDEKIYSLSKESLGADEALFTKDRPVIVAVGRLVHAKDYPTLLKAYKLVLEKLPARLVILGEGPEEADLKHLATKMGIAGSVSFLGFKSNPYNYMAKASVFVLSSVREGFGNVLVEAMACRTPVVSTDCKSGPNEIIQHGVSGLLVQVKNEQALAEAILQVLTNPVLREKLSLAGFERAKYFSIGKSVKEYESIFKHILL